VRSFSYRGLRVLATCALVSASRLAAAQGGVATASQDTQGPMTVERIRSGFLAAPDFRVTRFDGRTSEIAGGYAGWLTDQRLFVGGGASWLANGNRDRALAYGGVVAGWLWYADRPFGFGMKALVGGGEATLIEAVRLVVYPTPLPTDRTTRP
jgi:hypothetical protein